MSSEKYAKQDEQLYYHIQRLQQGYADSYTEVYNLSGKYLYKIIYDIVQDYHTTEDMLQETFIKIYNNIGSLQSPQAYYVWAGRIATNLCISYIRKHAFARCFSLEKTPEIPEGVTSLRWAFYLCKNLVEATNIPSTAKNASCMFNACEKLTKPPVIAEGVENISSIFSECSSLEQAPELPTTIKNMEQAFYNCINLKTMTRIHKNVTNMTLAFAKCSSLTGTICIDANPEKYKECFQYVDKNGWNIELTGESDMLGTLARERGAG